MPPGCRTTLGQANELGRNAIPNQVWYFNGKPVTGPKHIALGRRNGYTCFANHLTQVLGTKTYLCDFMDWVDESQPEESLFFFIQTAERIDIYLRDIPQEDLHKATVGVGRRVQFRRQLRIAYMTSWEINQVFHNGHASKTYWHVPNELTCEEVHRALGGEVPFERIVQCGIESGETLGAREMPFRQITQYYQLMGFQGLCVLLRRLEKVSWMRKLSFLDSYGTLLIRVRGQVTDRYTGIVEVTVHHDGVYIVQVYNANGHVVDWNRNVDRRSLGRILVSLIRKG